MIAWESYGNRWRLHPGEIALETAAYAGIARPETVEAIRAWLR